MRCRSCMGVSPSSRKKGMTGPASSSEALSSLESIWKLVYRHSVLHRGMTGPATLSPSDAPPSLDTYIERRSGELAKTSSHYIITRATHPRRPRPLLHRRSCVCNSRLSESAFP